MNVAIVGTGYVGLVSGACFAEMGNQVICVDIDADKVRRMQAGEVPIYEPDLDVLFERNTQQGRLSFTTDLASAVKASDIIFLALPTPPGEDGSADLSYVLGVARQMGPMIDSYKVVVDKSTVPVGTAEKVTAALAEHCDTDLFDVVSNPEFLREGVAVDDFLKPDRVVIGVSSERAGEIMQRLYQPFVRQGNPIYVMDVRSAEMTKYAANSYLATRITFMNEIANLCEQLGANVEWVRKGIGSDSRIGRRFLFPGIGYGGSCFPKDVEALVRTAASEGYDFSILNAVMAVNKKQKLRLLDKARAYYGALEGKTFGVWGLAFKPETDDIREAPALTLIEELGKAGAQVKAYDPEAMDNVANLGHEHLTLCSSAYEAIDGVDALFICTEWSAFRSPDFDEMRSRMRAPVIFDGRNLFDIEQMSQRDFHYESIGREMVSSTQEV